MRVIAELFGISRQAWYKRLQRQRKKAAQEEIIIDMVRQERKKMPRIGTRKLYKKLKPRFREMEVKMGRDKLFTLLSDNNMLVPRKKNYRKTTHSFHRFRKYPNRVKNVTIQCPEQVWVSDITYIPTEAGYCYLSLITDAYSKKVMGHCLKPHLRTSGPLKALRKALKNRVYSRQSMIHHSDRGFQYCSDQYTNLLEGHQIEISMTQERDPYENAIAERMNGILKREFEIGSGFVNYPQACKEIRRTIRIYNQERPHTSCKMLTPAQAHLVGEYTLKEWS